MIALWFQTPKARLESSSGLFPDFSRVTGNPEVNCCKQGLSLVWELHCCWCKTRNLR